MILPSEFDVSKKLTINLSFNVQKYHPGDYTMGNEELVAYCGLYCGDCFGCKGKIASLANELNKELKEVNFKKNADFFAEIPEFKTFKNYDSFVELLETLEKLKCDGCRSGGGPPFCEIRKCCGEKGIKGCWECDEFKDYSELKECEKLQFLKTHGDGHIKNLVILREKGEEAFIKGERNW